ncbi:MAG: HD domain-containing protein [Lachnospiraceae bacterium]|nr:HD domain-containing protein [Lachnospiraceae bacterium]
MTYIQEYREGNKFSGIYLCKSKQILKTKAGKTYYSLILQDKTGVIDAKVWELNNGIEEFESLGFIMSEGMVTIFQGSRQVNVSRIRRAQEGEYDPAEYIPASKYDREEMYEELKGFVLSIEEPHLKQLAEKFFIQDTGFVQEFKTHSAAKSVHHGFVGGLLQHTLAVTKLCDFFAAQYPVIDRDLLVTAALFHDIGKIWEISEFPANEYTDEGQLLGHIFLGAELIGKEVALIPGFPKTLAGELRHCILAHHGELEYGSPKKPAMAEAMALSFADNLDAKMETMTEVYDKSEPTLQWLGFNRLLDSNIRQSSGYLKKRKGE